MLRVATLVLAAAFVRAQTITGGTQLQPGGVYTLCQNLWGASAWLARVREGR